MQQKWLEDFLAVVETGSLVRAAELRNVTHAAFGRRIVALEEWAGAALLDRSRSPVRLTPAGLAFRDSARALLGGIAQARDELQGESSRNQRTVTIATGRTLARTVLADCLVRQRRLLADAVVRVQTASLDETIGLLERRACDFMLANVHPMVSIALDGRQFANTLLASERLVAVCRADATGAPLHPLRGKAPVPLLAFGKGLALHRLLEDRLANNAALPPFQLRVECDSSDALLEYALKGLGVAWLPWSLVSHDCKTGRLAAAGDKRSDIGYDIRLYRPKRRLHELAERLWDGVNDA
ncbi:LysR family transcriptional regulator [Roseateles noduli]|uniref:LysR family transcriptional regulator n=1 Tax=Roseateles noduli TaxID=2052484 RepID=UPI003D649B1A